MRESGGRVRVRVEGSFRRHAREAKSGGMGAKTSWFEDLRKVSHSYYFTNFPEDLREENLWKFFDGFGKVLDVFVCKRKNGKGRKFGFVRFKKEGLHSVLHKKLESVWIDSYKVFLRYQSEYPIKKAVVVSKGDNKANGTTGNNQGPSNYSLEFFTSDLELQWLDRCVVGNLKSLESVDSIEKALLEEGFENCTIKSIGGLQVIIECESFCQRNI